MAVTAVRPLRVAAVVVLVLGLVILVGYVNSRPEQPTAATDPTSSAPTTATPESAAASKSTPGPTVTLAFAGDVHFQGELASLLDQRDSTLGPMTQALASADVAMVNLESALTTGGSRTAKELEDPAQRYWFRSPPSALALLARSGVDVVSMANNHGADYGAAGLEDSLGVAQDSEVAVIGIGDDPGEAYRPFRTSVEGVDVAVFAADASRLESNDSIWDVQPGSGPGMATARSSTRLVAAVRQAAATDDVVAVYLHWGDEGVGCATVGQQTLAADLAAAGADVVVGAHAHLPLGAGMLDDTYVSYGLGNFLWYNNIRPDTGVLRVEIVDGQVVGDEWVPGEIPAGGGQPVARTGAARTAAVDDWRELRGCTDLSPGPGVTATDESDDQAEDQPDAADELPAYESTITTIPAAVRAEMIGSSHDPSSCPVEFDDLRLLTVSHVDFDGASRRGQLIVHRDHAADLVGVFGELYAQQFPIRRMQLVDDYAGDDNRSMAADNSSGYNCRPVAGSSRFSDHAYGAALDLNPVENPYVTEDGVLPAAGRRYVDVDRSPGAEAAAGVIIEDDVVTRAFARIGWEWGGDFTSPDFQHFYAS